MFNLSYDEIVERIKKEKGLSDKEISERVKAKLDKLSDLISKEGAAHLIANELGVKIFDNISRELKIDKIFFGMKSVSFVGKVVKLYPVNEYSKEKNGKKWEGKVCNMLIGDETGVIRVVMWDTNHISEIERGNLQEGSVLKINGGYVRDNNGREVHLGNQSRLVINPAGVNVIVRAKDGYSFRNEPSSKMIGEFNDGELVNTRGTIVQVFEPRFYEACPECNKKLEIEGDKFRCKEHGVVKENLVPIMNLFLDDGSGNIRVVAFRDIAELLIGLEKEKVLELRENPELFEEVKKELLGKELIVRGRVRKNEMFDRLELSANSVEEVNPANLLVELEKEFT